MRIIAAITVIMAAACGGNTGPVKGAHEAVERHYAVSLADAHAAIAKVLVDRYQAIEPANDPRTVVARAICRTNDGGRCMSDFHVESNAYSMASTGRTELIRTGSYQFQVYGGVVGDDGDVRIELGGHATDVSGRYFELGAKGAPDWMPHELDLARVAIDRALGGDHR